MHLGCQVRPHLAIGGGAGHPWLDVFNIYSLRVPGTFLISTSLHGGRSWLFGINTCLCGEPDIWHTEARVSATLNTMATGLLGGVEHTLQMHIHEAADEGRYTDTWKGVLREKW